MNSQFIPTEFAVELRDLGFNERILIEYDSAEIGTYYMTGRAEDARFDYQMKITYHQAIEFLLPMLREVVGAYRIIIVKATGAYWLQERNDGEMKGISDETNEDCVRQLIEVIKYGEKY